MASYVNEGGTVWVVELQRDVHKGDKFKGSDALAAVHGFVRLDEPKQKADKPKDEE